MKIFSPLKRLAFILVIVFALTVGATVHANPVPSAPSANLTKQIRHELVTLPYYGVFDNLAFKVEGDTVTLYGQVVRPATRSEAQSRVAHLPGVARVINNIQVLPLSSFDDAIRIRAYRTIFSYGSLYRYAMGANPSIHIIVDNGNLTLEGVVDSKTDADLAYIAARTVPGVFAVTNHLQYPGSNAR